MAATPDLIVLDVSLTARSCYKIMIIKYINEKKNKEKNQHEEKKLMKKKKKKSKLTGLTRQTWDSRHESLITK